MKVTKYSGELVHYDEQKLINSLRKSGADQAMAETIVKEIESEMYEGISSKKIYKRAYQLLKNISKEKSDLEETVDTYKEYKKALEIVEEVSPSYLEDTMQIYVFILEKLGKIL